jgi:hypothetical protein
MAGNINAKLFQHRNCFRPHAARSGPGAFNFESVASRMPEQALGHLTASRIARAQD